MKYIIVQQEKTYEEYPITEHINIGTKSFRIQNDVCYYNEQKICPDQWTTVEEEAILYLTEANHVYERKEKIFISEENDDICIAEFTAKLLIDTENIIVEGCNNDTILYLNQQKISDGIYPVEEGIVLVINTIKITVKKDYLIICGAGYQTTLLPTVESQNAIEHFPVYTRSPRLIKRIVEDKIKIETPPASIKPGKKGLLQMILPPLGMLAVSVLLGVVMKRGIYMLMSLSATGMTTIFTVTKYFQDKKGHKELEAKKKELYSTYLLGKRKEIYEKWTTENEAYHYNYPELSETVKMIESYSSRIYERSSMDDDFLTFSVGHSTERPAFAIEDKTTELDLQTNEYLEEGKELKKKFGTINKPQIVDLKKAHVGLVGEKSVIHEQLKLYVSQIVFAQSYHDVQFIAIYDHRYEEDFAWMRWLPHTKIRGLNLLGLVHSARTRDQVLSSMQQILKERKQRLEEGKKETRFLPHYVFLIDEPKVLMDHSIMEYLGTSMEEPLGFSLIYTTNQRANLPANIGTVLMLDDSEEGRLLLEEKELCNRKMHLYRTGDVNLEMMARNLGVLVHEQGISSHTPESITFFDMYGVRNPEELTVRKRWSQNNSSKTLAVPLGARAVDDMLELNLHEKAHGPHGLIAGTTGSGKSEIVQSYILSLAINFHPYEVGLLLIDYKGGGMANLFKNLPHLLGTITNLDGSESMRALASIQSELRRRQRVFGEYDVNHINAYNDLFKEGKAKEPIPHLFIISDEFAELKKEQPEFMKELVSTARIGRSLGVHLILATQKPSGVVDDQIWTNSKFKLCLKVQNEADSKEVLHTPDAANITQAGRAYLQVGNNEIYELFQSAWSGALYIKETEKEVTQDNRIYLVNEMGQGELINLDLRGSKEERKANETQLDAVVNHIRSVYEKEQGQEVKKPWLPSLQEKVVNPKMQIVKSEKADLDVTIGLIDVPEEQEQYAYTLNLAKQGNILYIASSGYGKSVFLANAALNLAVKNTVTNLNLYVLDFGNNALITLSTLPHMADYIMLDEEEKFIKFRDLITAEMAMRKKQMASVMAQNFAVYNETANVPLKAIVILIDNYDAIKEMGLEMEDYFTKLTRDGVGLGIYTIVTASRSSAIRYATMNNFKNKIAGFNFEGNEVKSIVGKSAYTLPEVYGRAMVKHGDGANVMQIYTPVHFENEVEYSKQIKDVVQSIRDTYPNEEAEHIAILPNELDYATFLMYEKESPGIVLGLDKERVKPKGFMQTQTPFLVLGDTGSGKTNVLKIILEQLPKDSEVYLFDSRSRNLYHYNDRVHYVTTEKEFEDFANGLSAEIKKRQMFIEMGLAQGKTPQQIFAEMENYYVLIDDSDDFCDFAGKNLPIAAGRMKRAATYGISFIVTANTNRFKGNDDFTQMMKSTKNGLLLSSQGYMTIFPVKATATFDEQDGFLMLDGKGGIIRMPLMEQ